MGGDAATRRRLRVRAEERVDSARLLGEAEGGRAWQLMVEMDPRWTRVHDLVSFVRVQIGLEDALLATVKIFDFAIEEVQSASVFRDDDLVVLRFICTVPSEVVPTAAPKPTKGQRAERATEAPQATESTHTKKSLERVVEREKPAKRKSSAVKENTQKRQTRRAARNDCDSDSDSSSSGFSSSSSSTSYSTSTSSSSSSSSSDSSCANSVVSEHKVAKVALKKKIVGTAADKPKDKADKSKDKVDKPKDKVDKPKDKADKPKDKADKFKDKVDKTTDKADKTDKPKDKADKPKDKADKTTDKADKTDKTDKSKDKVDKPKEKTDKPKEKKETKVPASIETTVLPIVAGGAVDVRSLWAAMRSQQDHVPAQDQGPTFEDDYADEYGDYYDEDYYESRTPQSYYKTRPNKQSPHTGAAAASQGASLAQDDPEHYFPVQSPQTLQGGDHVRFRLLALDARSKVPVLSAWRQGMVEMVDGDRLQVCTEDLDYPPGEGGEPYAQVFKAQDLYNLQIYQPNGPRLLVDEQAGVDGGTCAAAAPQNEPAGEEDEWADEDEEVDQLNASLLTEDLAQLLQLKRQKLL